MKIAVFMGGSSAERDVSLMSGKAVYEGLCIKGHAVSLYDVEWGIRNTLFTALEKVIRDNVDVVFSALHGGLGENGGIQGIFEAAGIIYTGSGITASAVAMNKDLSKTLFVHHNIPTAPWIIGEANCIERARIESSVGYPCIVKPVDQGSSIGIAVVKEPSDMTVALDKAVAYGDKVLIEKYLPGSELSVPILGDAPLPIIEIQPSHDIYDYDCKYTAGMTRYIVPATIPDKLAHEVQSYAMKVFHLLGLRDIARIDFRLDEHGVPQCFEANTLPGMTTTSLVPKSAAQAGITFPELVSLIAESAYRRKGN